MADSDQTSAGQGGLSPAAMALITTIATKGFQNRRKIGAVLSDFFGQGQGAEKGGAGLLGGGGSGLSGVLGGIAGALGGSSSGGILSQGLSDLLQKFEQAGHGDAAKSWVKRGENQGLQPHQLEQAIGAAAIDEVAAKAGIGRDELLQRLSADLPKQVDELTPDERVPSSEEADRMTRNGSGSQ